jgi:opacity protein-like surface antigen
MKIRMLAAALLGLVLAATPSSAGAPIWLGANLGLSMPTGEYTDAASLGFLAGLTGTYMFNDHFGVGGDVNLHSPGVADDFEEAMAAAAGSTVDVSFHAIQVTPHVRLVVPSHGTVKPYLQGGLGLYNVGSRIEGGSLHTDGSETRFGFHLDIGAQAPITSVFAWSGELAYHSIGTDGSPRNLLTLAAGLHFGFGSR